MSTNTSVLTHGPHLETPDANNPCQRWPAGSKSNLEYLDHLMGKLLDGLKAEGLDENTYVIFLGDNGTGSDGKRTLIVLMPNGRAQKNDRAKGNVFESAPAFGVFERDLLDDVIPAIESRTRSRPIVNSKHSQACRWAAVSRSTLASAIWTHSPGSAAFHRHLTPECPKSWFLMRPRQENNSSCSEPKGRRTFRTR